MKNFMLDILGFFLATCLLVGIIAVVHSVAIASGKISFCYVEESRMSAFPSYTLMGHRDWRRDIDVVTTQTYQEAVNHASAINCSIGIGR